MKRYFTTGLILDSLSSVLLASLLVVYPPLSLAHASEKTEMDCASQLLSEPEHWRAELLSAADRLSSGGVVYALTRLVLTDSTLSRDERGELRSLARAIEYRGLRERIKSRHGKMAAQAFAYFGAVHLTSTDVYGVRPYRAAEFKNRTLKSLATDLFFTFGPTFGVAVVGLDKALVRMPYKSLIKLLLEKSNALDVTMDLATKYGTASFGGFGRLDEIITSFMQDTRTAKPSLAAILGRIFIPITLVTGTMAATGMTPYENIRHTIGTDFYGREFYEGEAFVNDIQREVPRALKGKILVAYSDAMFFFADNLPVAPLVFKEFQSLQKTAAKVDFLKFHTLNDLSTADLSQYDNVVLFFHGSDGGIPAAVAGQSLPRMKKDAILVFFSCSLGKAGGADNGRTEDWITVAKQMLDGGVAISSTQILTVTLAAPVEIELWRKIVGTASQIGGGQIIQDTAAGIADLLYKYASDYEYANKPAGIRIFRSEDSTVKFIESSRNTFR